MLRLPARVSESGIEFSQVWQPAWRPNQPRQEPTNLAGVAFVYLGSPVSFELVEKRSRFLAAVHPVTTEAQAKAIIATIAKTHHTARHHCTALVLGPAGELQRSNDDGEPAGTAGAPMLQVLRRRQVTDVLAVVTRYFGGTLLGAPGLVRAYSGAVAGALDQAELVRKVSLGIVQLEISAALAGREEARVRALVAATPGARLEAVTHGTQTHLELALTTQARAALDQALASGRITARLIEAGQRLTTIA